MLIGCCSWSYHRSFESGDMDIFGFMEECARRLRVYGVEITDGHMAAMDTDYLSRVKKAAVDLQLVISGLTVSNDFGKTSKEENDRELELVRNRIELAAQLGAPILRVFAGWPVQDKEQQWAPMVEYMRAACGLAEKHGVVLAVENHNHGGFLQTFADVDRLLKDVDSEWLRLNLDTGNYIDGFPSIEPGMGSTVHVHAKMLKVNADGSEADLDYVRIADVLRRAGYRGFVSVEYEGDEAEADAVARCIEYLKKLLNCD